MRKQVAIHNASWSATRTECPRSTHKGRAKSKHPPGALTKKRARFKRRFLNWFEDDFGVSWSVLGDVEEAREIQRACRHGVHPSYVAPEGQADFHLDLDLCLLGSESTPPRAVLAEPSLGLAHIEAILRMNALFEGHYLSAAEMRRIYERDCAASVAWRSSRLDAHARVLRELNYQVTPMVNLRLLDEHNHLGRVNTSYNCCTVVPARTDRGPSAYLLAFGIESVDVLALDTSCGLGIEPIVITQDWQAAHELMALRGGLHRLYAKLG